MSKSGGRLLITYLDELPPTFAHYSQFFSIFLMMPSGIIKMIENIERKNHVPLFLIILNYSQLFPG